MPKTSKPRVRAAARAKTVRRPKADRRDVQTTIAKHDGRARPRPHIVGRPPRFPGRLGGR